MTFKLNKYTIFTALLTTMAAICMAQAICLLIPSAQTASADEEEGGRLPYIQIHATTIVPVGKHCLPVAVLQGMSQGVHIIILRVT